MTSEPERELKSHNYIKYTHFQGTVVSIYQLMTFFEGKVLLLSIYELASIHIMICKERGKADRFFNRIVWN